MKLLRLLALLAVGLGAIFVAGCEPAPAQAQVLKVSKSIPLTSQVTKTLFYDNLLVDSGFNAVLWRNGLPYSPGTWENGTWLDVSNCTWDSVNGLTIHVRQAIDNQRKWIGYGAALSTVQQFTPPATGTLTIEDRARWHYGTGETACVWGKSYSPTLDEADDNEYLPNGTAEHGTALLASPPNYQLVPLGTTFWYGDVSLWHTFDEVIDASAGTVTYSVERGADTPKREVSESGQGGDRPSALSDHQRVGHGRKRSGAYKRCELER